MTVKGCIYSHLPDWDKNIAEGSEVVYALVVYNCGDTEGNIYATVKKDGVDFSPGFKFESIKPGIAYRYEYNDYKRATFTMPSATVKLTFYTGHWDWDTNRWGEDAKKTVTLTPVSPTPTPTPTRKQHFRVYDPKANPVPDASVKITEGPSCTTDENGHCSVDVEKGKAYSGYASKKGYKKQDFSLPPLTVVNTKYITLHPAPTPAPAKKATMICYFDVLDKDGNSTRQLTVGERYEVKGNLYQHGGWLGCNNPTKIALIGKTIFFQFVGGVGIGHATSDEYGYAGLFYWTPRFVVVGTRSILAIYNGDANYKACNSKTINITIY